MNWRVSNVEIIVLKSVCLQLCTLCIVLCIVKFYIISSTMSLGNFVYRRLSESSSFSGLSSFFYKNTCTANMLILMHYIYKSMLSVCVYMYVCGWYHLYLLFLILSFSWSCWYTCSKYSPYVCAHTHARISHSTWASERACERVELLSYVLFLSLSLLAFSSFLLK